MERQTGRRRANSSRSAAARPSPPMRRRTPAASATASLPVGPPVELQLLGPFVLRCGGRTLRALPKKAQALLAYLGMQRGRVVPREQLADLLWGRSGGEQARRSLRQCLMSVRAALKATGDNVLLADGDSVSVVNGPTMGLDVADFEVLGRSQDSGDLERASALYRDEFLAGLQIASESVADWMARERRRLASAMSDELFRLASAYLQAGDTERA